PMQPPTPDQAPVSIIAELIPTIPNTPVEPPRTMEDNTRLMPTRGHHTMPKWDEEKVRELAQYFQELEYLFRDCRVNDNRQKKDYAVRYLTYNTGETWMSVKEYEGEFTPAATHNKPEPAAHAYTYEEWKAEIFKLYPGSESRDRYTHASTVVHIL
ncbi:hypothetical protein C0995_007074, partial [Termitomyces sp. Mi166